MAKRSLIILASFLVLSVGPPAEARVNHHQLSATTTHDSSGDYYTNVRGYRVHRPVKSSSAPLGASAQCRDGSWSFSEHRSGTCSHHGGVGHWQ